jgi:hypothetical protein
VTPVHRSATPNLVLDRRSDGAGVPLVSLAAARATRRLPLVPASLCERDSPQIRGALPRAPVGWMSRVEPRFPANKASDACGAKRRERTPTETIPRKTEKQLSAGSVANGTPQSRRLRVIGMNSSGVPPAS